MEWIAYVIAAVFFVLGAACVVLVVLSLPGTWVLLALAVIVELTDGWYLPAERSQTFSWWVLIAAAALTALGEVVDTLAGVAGAKKGGASRRGMIGAVIGGLAGALVFTPLFFFVPVVGVFLGAVLGTFVGAVIGEMTAPAMRLSGSMKPAIGATIGRVIGTVAKLGVAIALWLGLTVAAVWP